MRFSHMFMDDVTKQLSLGRVLSAILFIWLIGCTGHLLATGKGLVDIPTNWMVVLLGFYGINKTSSTTTSILGVKDGAK